MNEKIIFNDIKITNPNKIVFDNGVKKINVVNYYNAVSKLMFPFLKNRIVSVVRCPQGIDSACFFKKHPENDLAGIKKIIVTGEKEHEFFFIENSSGIISQAQMNTIEFHIWASNVNYLENPDIMTFDLDPDEKMDINNIRQGVNDLKSILDELSLVSFLKTSGGKGYHVVLPFQPVVNWKIFHDFSQKIAKVMEEKWPQKYTSNIRKIKRKNKIYVDFGRNTRGATSIAPYSLRARIGAKVSMPIEWSELYKISPNQIDLKIALERIKKNNPWEGFFEVKQELKSFR